MSEAVKLSPFRPELPDKPGERRYWGGLYGSSKALALTSACSNQRKLLVIVTASLNDANRLLEELQFYRPEKADDGRLLSFPDWETLPYDQFSPYQDIVSDRLSTLSQLPAANCGILTVAVATIMHRLLPKSYVSAYSLNFAVGQELQIDAFREELTACGYRWVAQVMEHGDVAMRGSIIDIFPMGSREPYRLDLFDKTIDSIRAFDPENQRSKDQVTAVRVLPARETALQAEYISRFRSNWRTRFEGNPAACPVYKDVSDGIAPAGIEYYLPLFYEETSSLFDYLSDNSLVVLDEGVEQAAEAFWLQAEERYEQGRYNRERPLLPPRDMFYHPTEFHAQVNRFPRIEISGLSQDDSRPGRVNFSCKLPVKLPVEVRAAEPLSHLKSFIRDFDGRILLVAESAGRRETILGILARNGRNCFRTGQPSCRRRRRWD